MLLALPAIPLRGGECGLVFDAPAFAAPDCNGNGYPDECDAAPFPAGFGRREDIDEDAISVPRSLALLDLDRDGDLDLTGLANHEWVFVLLAEGGGRFAEPRFHLTGAAGAAVLKAGDLDGDGDADLAVASSAVSHELSVLLNDGQGRFAFPSIFPHGAYPAALAAADLDRDGDLDLAVANSAGNNVIVLWNDGKGAFASIAGYNGGVSPADMAARDLDGDGDLDLAIAAHGSGKLSVLLNRGGMVFGEPVDHESSGPPSALAAEDFDGDGDTDIASVSNLGRALTLFQNPGNGGFSRRSAALAFDPVSLMAADLDLDGRMDLVTSNNPGGCDLYRSSITLLLGTAGLSFLAPREIKMGKSFVLGPAVAGDIDADGDMDLVLPRFDHEPVPRGGLTMLWNDPTNPHGDCDSNGVADDCELEERDCNTNGIPDSCDLQRGMSEDCDADGMPDECERDCDRNGRADECDLAEDPGRDVDRDGIPDSCEPAALDCNLNGMDDAKEVLEGRSSDCNANGLPDDCELSPAPRFELHSLERHALDAAPASAALADLDGDGDLDLAVALAAREPPIRKGSIQILLNGGRGRLEAAGGHAANGDPAVVLSRDFDGDGDSDLAILDRPLECQDEPLSFVSVLSRSGQGGLALTSRLALAGDHASLAAGDLDGDGDMDLVAGRTGSAADEGIAGEIAPLLNQGRGQFLPGPGVAFSGGAKFLVAADLDADRDLDLAAGSPDAETLEVLWNDGAGRYAPGGDISALPDRVLSLAASDMDRDGLDDLIAGVLTGEREAARASIARFWNEGNRRFERATALSVREGPRFLVAGDLDADGHTDLATGGIPADARSFPPRNSLSILGGSRDRTAGEPVVHVLDSDPGFAATGDLDGDGDPDLTLLSRYTQEVIVLENAERGRFPSVPLLEDGAGDLALVAADFDGDGARDLALALQSPGSVNVLQNIGDASFLPERRAGLVRGARALAAADLDGREGLDLAAAGEFTLAVLLNDAGGAFTRGAEFVIGSNPAAVTAADLDGDGDLDLVTANALGGDVDDNISLLLNAGGGSFGFPRNLGVGRQARSLAAADIDRDGDTDLAVVHAGSGDVWLLHNAGDGDLSRVRKLAVGSGAYQLETADLGGDGALDLVVTRPYALILLQGKGDGAFGEATEIQKTAHNSLALSDVENDGDIDLVAFFSDYLAFLPNAGDGTFGELESLGARKGDGQGGSGDPPLLPQAMAAADLDLDGREDLATAWRYAARIDIHLNRTPSRLRDHDGNGTPDVCDDPGAHDFHRGDARDDGRLDISDAVTILRHLFVTGEPLPCPEAADANDDGAVNLSDPVRILGFLFLGDEPLPAPRLECGRDPTGDALSCHAYAGC